MDTENAAVEIVEYDVVVEPDWSAYSDRELMEYMCHVLYTASKTIEDASAQISPMMEKFQSGGILGMMGGGLFGRR